MWQVLGKEDTFPLFCVIIMVSGVLSYLLAVYQIFMGLKEDKIVTGGGQEAGLEMTTMAMAQEDITAGVGGLRRFSTNNATVWPKMKSERQEISRRENGDSLSCSINSMEVEVGKEVEVQVEVGSDPAEGSSARRVPGKVKSGSTQQAGSQLKVEMEIPGLLLETSKHKDLYAENKKNGIKGRVIYPGYSTRASTPTPIGPEEARWEVEANLEEADSWKPQVMKNVQPSGETWQLRGNTWVEKKANKNP